VAFGALQYSPVHRSAGRVMDEEEEKEEEREDEKEDTELFSKMQNNFT
jgi:hypothetical protein